MRDTHLQDVKSDFNCDIWQVIYDEQYKNLASDEMRDVLLTIEETLLSQEEEN